MPRKKSPEEILEAKRQAYAVLLSIIKPIMKDLAQSIEASTVFLADKEGHILEVMGNYEFLPVDKDGKLAGLRPNIIDEVLEKETPLEVGAVSGARNSLQSLYSAAAPIRTTFSTVMGVLCVSSPRPLPEGILQVMSFAARSIEKELSGKLNLYALMNYINYGLFVINGVGKILNINKKCQELLGLTNKDSVVGGVIGDFIPNYKELLDYLLSESRERFYFNLKTRYGSVLYCSLRMKQVLVLDDDPRKSLILFSFVHEQKKPEEGAGKRTPSSLFTFGDIVGQSPAWVRVKEIGVKAARVTSNVLIIGESGTGKEVIAQAIHNASGRTGPFVPINCGAIPKELLQSELFGYEPGAFTGAKKTGSEGKFEIANGGTVFLDEIGEMPVDMQVSLLRFLQDKTVVRVGGTTPRKVDVRIIAATNRDLDEAVKNGTFREDLYYRLNVITIKLPPLRERKEDIPLLVNSMVREVSNQLGIAPPRFDDDALEVLIQHDWPGNVRELRNIVEYAVVFAENGIVTRDCLPQRLIQQTAEEATENLRELEFNHIKKVLSEYNGNVTQAARALGITRSTLYKKLRQMEKR